MDREYLLWVSRVYLSEAKARKKKDRGFSNLLLNWSINATRKAIELYLLKQPVLTHAQKKPSQLMQFDLF